MCVNVHVTQTPLKCSTESTDVLERLTFSITLHDEHQSPVNEQAWTRLEPICIWWRPQNSINGEADRAEMTSKRRKQNRSEVKAILIRLLLTAV